MSDTEKKMKVLVDALAQISAKKLTTLDSNDPGFREGANEAYKRAAAIADNALASTGNKERVVFRV